MLKTLFETIAPHHCHICKNAGSIICDSCRGSELCTPVSVCYRCNKLTTNFKTCRSCRSSSDVFACIWATEYSGWMREVIVSTKKHGSKQGSEDLGRLLSDAAEGLGVSPNLLSWVPTAQARMRQRGFDHAEIMAKQVARRINIPIKIVLLRKSSSRQVGATRIRRKEQIRGAFEVMDSESVRGRSVLLVDDVITTGATIEEAARVLKLAGARRITVLVCAYNR